MKPSRSIVPDDPVCRNPNIGLCRHHRRRRRLRELASRLDPAKVAAEREKYGATADQRIEESRVPRRRRPSTAVRREQADYTRSSSKQLLTEHDPRVRAAMLAVAADFDTPAAAAICRGGLEDPEPRVRMAACEAWRKRGGPEAASLLGGRVSADADIDVRLKAVRELGAAGRRGGRPRPRPGTRRPGPGDPVPRRQLAQGGQRAATSATMSTPGEPGRPTRTPRAREWSIAEGFRTAVLVA